MEEEKKKKTGRERWRGDTKKGEADEGKTKKRWRERL